MMRNLGSRALALTVFSLATAAQGQGVPEGSKGTGGGASGSEPRGAPSNESSSAVPRGASGAMVVPTKPEDAPPTPPPAVIVPPVLVRDEGAQYPEAALKEGSREQVTVILLLEIDPTGAVRKAAVENPKGGPFEEAALSAAQRLVFEPARKDGRAIAARIKHRYDFAPPPARFAGRVFRSGNGAPLAGVKVRLRVGDAIVKETETADDGTFRVDEVPFGTYAVEIEAEGFETSSAQEEAVPGQVTEVKVRLDALRPKPSAEASKEGAKPEDEIEEVRVRTVRPPREVTRRTLEQRELSRIPGTNGDALRAIQNLPGVARPPGLAGLLIIRGSSPQSTNTFVDGTLVPLIYHFGGLSSVIPTELLERIDFYPGNFSAMYGRVTGGIVDAGIRDPKKDKLHGLAQADLIDTRMLAEGPIGDTGWTFAVAGRRSWVDVWLKPVLEGLNAGVSTAPVYYDYQALVQRNLPKGGSLRVALIGADDRLAVLVKEPSATDPGIGGGISFHTGFWRGQIRYRQRWGADTEVRSMVAVGRDLIEFNLGDNQFALNAKGVTGRFELSHKLVQGLTVNTGLDMIWGPYDVYVRLPPPPRPGEPPSGPGLSRPPLEFKNSTTFYRPAAYVELETTPFVGTRLVPGVRVDYAKDSQDVDVAPRLVARQDLTRSFPKTALKGGIGLFYQPPQPQETTSVFGVPDARSVRSAHYGFGVERELTRLVDLSVEGFYKDTDFLFTPRLGSIGQGRVYGVETLLRYKPDERFFGWLAYTLSRSVVRDSPGEPEHPGQFDQTHILTVLGSYRLGRGWEIGGRFRFVSGNLVTKNNYGFFDENAGSFVPLQAYPPLSFRLPSFHQLDVRVDKVWAFPGWTLSAYLDVQNAYNQGNVEGVSYNYNYTRSTYATGLPFLPSLGLRAEL